jgi:carboxylesterase type B
LLLDAYLPPESDKRTERPVMVFVHGGSFTSGDKSGEAIVTFAKELAKRGFVSISINYRLTGEFYDWINQQMIYDAVEDARAAVRYVRSFAKDYRIDTDRILLIGESAGAVTSLYYGYVESA